MANTIKALSDYGVNTTLILVGVADNINDLMGEHASIGRCVEQIPMPRMNTTERKEILDKIIPRLGMKLHDDALWKIVHLSRGLPSYVHSLGLYSSESAISRRSILITESDVDAAMKRVLERSQESIKDEYSKATHSNRSDSLYKQVLLACALADTDTEGRGTFAPLAVCSVFSNEVDYAMLVKIYGADPQAETRYSPAKCIGAEKKPKIGNPDSEHISTSYAERSNLTMRMHMRRFTRLTNAFSKKVENHAAAIALHTMYYNFVRIHQTLRVTPAMAAGVTDKLWEVSDIVEMLEQWELANFKPEYQFVVRQYAIGKGHSVSVMWRGGEVDTIFGFEKEVDALEWIKEKSQAWLIQHK
jgi:hypothetical protein